MRVSVALHDREPEDNQRQHEAAYRDYNRAYADLVSDGKGGGVCKVDVVFPRCGADPLTVHFFSIGVCEGAPDTGGAIIALGVLGEPLEVKLGLPVALKARFEVTSDRLKELGLKL